MVQRIQIVASPVQRVLADGKAARRQFYVLIRLTTKGVIDMAFLSWNLSGAFGKEHSLPNQPIPTLDLERYAGTWHEIAHLPLYFEKQCSGEITATYSIHEDKTVQVHNACRTQNGSMDRAAGVARPGTVQGALKVSFAPRWLRWIPFTWADYWVIDLDPQYQWAVVGSPSKRYLWVLSRSPSMSSTLFGWIKERAAKRGYPVDKFIIAAPLR